MATWDTNLQPVATLRNISDSPEFIAMNETLNALKGGQMSVSTATTTQEFTDALAAGFNTFIATENGTYANGQTISGVDFTKQDAFMYYIGTAWSQEVKDRGLSDSAIDKTDDPELFDKTQVINGKYIDISSGVISDNAAYKISGLITVTPNTSYTASHLGTVHNAIPFRFTDASSNYISIAVSPTDADSFTFTTPANAAFVQFTVKTGKVGDNMDINIISLQKTGSTPQRVIGINGLNLYSSLAVNYDKLGYTPGMVGKNLFPLGASLNGYYDTSTFLFVSSSLYKCTPLFKVPAGKTATISGYGAIHHPLVVAFYKADGITQCSPKGMIAPADSGPYTFTAPGDCVYIGYTWKTGKSGDTSIETAQQFEIGAAATAYETPVKGIQAIGINPIVAATVASDPVKDTDPVSYGFLKTRTSRATEGKRIFLFGDSITTTDGIVTNWPTYALPLMGITSDKAHNFAASGAHWEDFTGATTRQQLSEQVAQAIALGITPDIVVISIGTNSYASSKFGSYAATMAKAVGDLDQTIVMDAERKFMRLISETWPDARKFYGTPLQRASMDVDTQRTFNDQYVKMAQNYNYTIIDAFNESGYLHEFLTVGAATRYSDDGLHPNALFKAILGSFYAKRILATCL